MASKIAVAAAVISWYFGIVLSDISIQSNRYCGSNTKPLEERVLDVDELVISSHTGDLYYIPGRDCITTIIGKKYHQWEVQLQLLDIDGHECRFYTPCCNDYLKIFNSYRVDNARLFPSIPWRGLCGSNLPKRSTFTSTQNYLTVQLNADHRMDSKRGFILRLRQFPRKNAGSEFYTTGYIGGWNDGTLSELQIDWSQQEQIPGDYVAGRDPTFEFDPKGVSCYECLGCKRDYFKTSSVGVSVKDGCFVCTKEWIRGNAQTVRQCMSRSMLQEKLLTLRDPSSGSERITDFRDCRTFIRGVQGSTYVTLCLCGGNKCNEASAIHCSLSLLILSVLGYFVSKL